MSYGITYTAPYTPKKITMLPIQNSKLNCLTIVLSLFLVSCLPSLADSQGLTVINATSNYDISIKNIKVHYTVNKPVSENPSELQDVVPGEENEHSWGQGWISWNDQSLYATAILEDRRDCKLVEYPFSVSQNTVLIETRFEVQDIPNTKVKISFQKTKEQRSAYSSRKYVNWVLRFFES